MLPSAERKRATDVNCHTNTHICTKTCTHRPTHACARGRGERPYLLRGDDAKIEEGQHNDEYPSHHLLKIPRPFPAIAPHKAPLQVRHHAGWVVACGRARPVRSLPRRYQPLPAKAAMATRATGQAAAAWRDYSPRSQLPPSTHQNHNRARDRDPGARGKARQEAMARRAGRRYRQSDRLCPQ